MPRVAKSLSALAVSRLTTPGLYAVGEVPGLCLQVLPAGGRTWLLRVLVAGKRREIGLGGYPAVTLADARTEARRLRADIRQGRDPVADRRAAKSAQRASRESAKTFKQAALAYIEIHEPAWKNAKHGQQWRNTLEQYAYPVIGELLVAHVEREHVLAVLEPIWQAKTETASRLRSRIELVLSFAMQRGYRPEGLNPARWRGGLDKLLPAPGKIAKAEHHPALPLESLGPFVAKLRAVPGMGARALEFAILTAARSGEVRGATWAEIDLDAALWVVPAERMKAGREHRVPLSDAALAVLNALPKDPESGLVFPSPRGGTLSDMTLTAVLRRLAVPAVPHGFRSSFRDWAAERTAYPGDMAEMALAHAIGDKVEAAYRRGDMVEKRRRMMNDWAGFLSRDGGSAQVIDLQVARA